MSQSAVNPTSASAKGPHPEPPLPFPSLGAKTGEPDMALKILYYASKGPLHKLHQTLNKAFPEWPKTRVVALQTLLSYPPLLKRVLRVSESYERLGEQAMAFEGAAVWLESEMLRLAEAWKEHPQGEDTGEEPWRAEVLLMFSHRYGRDGKHVSYYQGSFASAFSKKEYAWQKRAIIGDEENQGRFIAAVPVPPSMQADTQGAGFVNNSPASMASRGYFAREMLKPLLTADARKWLQRARRANSRTKGELLSHVMQDAWILHKEPGASRVTQKKMVHKKTKEVRPTPDIYRNNTKGELWMKVMLPDSMKKVLGSILRDVEGFWPLATGKVPPKEFEDMLLPLQERVDLRVLHANQREASRHHKREGHGQRALPL